MKVSLVKEVTERRYVTEGREESREVYREAVSKARDRMGEIQDANKRRKTDSIGTSKDFVRIILSNPNNT